MECGAPEAEAPLLIRHDEQAHSCFFARQPESEVEVEQALAAVWASCCSAVRYAGEDATIVARLTQMGCAAAIDGPPSRDPAA